MASIDRLHLLRHLRAPFAIDWHGHHGGTHCARVRVRANGLMLSAQTGANHLVVELFAFFHDSQRINEWDDPGHGARRATLAGPLRGRYFDASDDAMNRLVAPCQGHSDDSCTGHSTVLTCRDADRLDLLRGITPRTGRLCTVAARERRMMAVANLRARAWVERCRGRGRVRHFRKPAPARQVAERWRVPACPGRGTQMAGPVDIPLQKKMQVIVFTGRLGACRPYRGQEPDSSMFDQQEVRMKKFLAGLSMALGCAVSNAALLQLPLSGSVSDYQDSTFNIVAA